MEWTTACPDWEQRIVDGRSLIPFPPLFADQQKAGIDAFKELKVVDMASGDYIPSMGDVTRDWMLDFVGHVFGSYEEETGRRLIREYFMLISKKNSKSTSAAGIMMTALIRNWRLSGEYLILAPTKEIADNSYTPARDMVLRDDRMKSIFHTQDNIRTITHRITGANLKVVAADSDVVGGKKAIGVLVDELWLFGKQINAENMLREATGGLTSRKEGFVIYLTTQSDAPPQGVFKQKLEYARQVRDGTVHDPAFLPVLYEFPEWMLKKKLHREASNFYITNPNLGASVDEDYLIRERQKAMIEGETSMIGFLAKHLNVQIGQTMRADRWAGADFWEDAGISKANSLEALMISCEVVVCGIDGGGLDDLLGFYVIGRCRFTQRWLGWAHAWAHKIVLDRRKELAPVLMDLQKDGEVTIVEEPGEDVVELAGMVVKIFKAGLFPEKHAIGVDSAGIGDIVEELTNEINGIPMDLIIAISQGWRLNGAIKTTERRVAGKTLIHSGQKLMAFAVGSARTELKGNNTTVTKQASGSAKIDPVMAMFNAVSLMALNPSARPNLSEALKDPIIV